MSPSISLYWKAYVKSKQELLFHHQSLYTVKHTLSPSENLQIGPNQEWHHNSNLYGRQTPKGSKFCDLSLAIILQTATSKYNLGVMPHKLPRRQLDTPPVSKAWPIKTMQINGSQHWPGLNQQILIDSWPRGHSLEFSTRDENTT